MKLSCEHCSFRSHRRREMIRHSRVHRHRCIHCDTLCSTKSELKKHILQQHQVTQSTQTEHTRSPPRPRKTGYSRPVRRPRWEPARHSRPSPRPAVRSEIVRSRSPRRRSPSPIRSDTDPLGLLDSPVKISF